MTDVVITGGSGSLGHALRKAGVEANWTLAAPTREELDLREADQVVAYFEARRVDLLICAAGVAHDALLFHQTEQQWDEVLAVNFTGAVACAGAVVGGMAARGEGHIIFISSYSALRPPPGQAAYAASKAALLGLASSLAVRHGRNGVRVNTILPGFMETPMTAKVAAKRLEQVRADHALPDFNTPDRVARFVRFLHESLPHTSGQVFQLDSRVRPF